MRSLSDKLLAAILALVLGFSPLQGAVAAVLDTPSQGMGMHQMMESQGDQNSVPANQMSHDYCQQNKMDDDCTSHAGASSHCSSCVVGLIPVTTINITPTLISGPHPSSDGFISQHAPSLYRPPRV
ncbi:MAG: hypothetical protein ABFS08_13190 [Pseudomonadota bacterium]